MLLRGDMIALYKMVTGKYSEDSCIKFKFVNRVANQTRGNKFKIFQEHVYYNLHKYYFSNRVIQIWNSLPHQWRNYKFGAPAKAAKQDHRAPSWRSNFTKGEV